MAAPIRRRPEVLAPAGDAACLRAAVAAGADAVYFGLAGFNAREGDAAHAVAPVELEVFVHGALCIAYSGQCLTSEAIGGRSANRGACAQACRLPYELLVDGALRDLGDAAYLLSPEDLEASALVPELARAGVVSLKIEGRLKGPEYVAATTRLYRRAVDAVLGEGEGPTSDLRTTTLQMYIRGSGPGVLAGIA